MRIRQATPDDADVVHDIVQRAYLPYVAEFGVRPRPLDDDVAVRIAAVEVELALDEADGDAPLGVLVTVIEPDHLQIDNVAVDPDRHGRGIGRALLRHAEDVARERGLPELRLYTHARMTRNLELYRRIGYVEVERRQESGFDRVFLVKRLTPTTDPADPTGSPGDD